MTQEKPGTNEPSWTAIILGSSSVMAVLVCCGGLAGLFRTEKPDPEQARQAAADAEVIEWIRSLPTIDGVVPSAVVTSLQMSGWSITGPENVRTGVSWVGKKSIPNGTADFRMLGHTRNDVTSIRVSVLNSTSQESETDSIAIPIFSELMVALKLFGSERAWMSLHVSNPGRKDFGTLTIETHAGTARARMLDVTPAKRASAPNPAP